MENRLAKNFWIRSLYVWFFGLLVALFPVRLVLSISGISTFAFLFGILFNGTCHAKICSRKILQSFDAWFFGLLVVCAAVVLRYPEFRFLPFCPEFFLMGRVRQNLLSENFAVIRCLVFCRFVVCAAVVLRYFMVRFLFLALVLFASCRFVFVRFCSRSRAFPLRLSSSFLFFSSFSLGGRPGRGFLSCSPPPLLGAKVASTPIQA